MGQGHQITAYGGSGKFGKAPFSQAILQSRGFMPKYAQNANFGRTLHFASRVTEKTSHPPGSSASFPSWSFITRTMRLSDIRFVDGFHIRSLVDHQFVPDLPSRLFREGKFDHSLNIMQPRTSQEGLVLASPFDQTPSEFGG